jgi:hypothetical protein
MVFQRIKNEAQCLYEQFYDILEKTDFSIPTFLAFGGVFQLLSLAYLPSHISALLPLLWLGWRLTKSAFDSRNVFQTSFTDVKRGKHMTSLPDRADGVVVFVLGARLNHPFGKLSPGTVMLDIPFKNMWREAEKNRNKWGCKYCPSRTCYLTYYFLYVLIMRSRSRENSHPRRYI